MVIYASQCALGDRQMLTVGFSTFELGNRVQMSGSEAIVQMFCQDGNKE